MYRHWPLLKRRQAPTKALSILSRAIPALSAAGNLWNRLPQIRGEYKDSGFGVKFGLLRPFSADETGRLTGTTGQANQTDQPGSGELGRVPMIQALAEVTPKIAGRLW